MDEEIKKLLEENLKLTQEIHAMTKKIKGHMTFQRIVSYFYLFIIIAPIVLGFIYLPPLLNSLFSQYKDILGIQGGSTDIMQSLLNGGTGNIDVNSIKGLINK